MQEKKNKKTIFSGMQATGVPSLGNYLGAIKNWSSLQDDYNCFYCIVNLHSLTVRQDPQELRKKSRELLMLYIACGLDPEKNVIYYQSHVPGHAELSWILSCYTYMGELNRMTQFKEKSLRHAANINAGLFTYPVLMAADILLFQTDLVPVGSDQKQHLELCRDVAERFNGIYGDVFTIPEPYIPQVGARIMSLQDPTKKMSKSEEENMNNVIFLLDEPNIIRSKIKKAVTDSEAVVRHSEDKPGVSNLLNIYSAFTGKSISDAEKDFSGQGYGYFKESVAEVVVDGLSKIQEEFKRLQKEKDYIDGIIKRNAEIANMAAERTMRKVNRKIGLADKIL